MSHLFRRLLAQRLPLTAGPLSSSDGNIVPGQNKSLKKTTKKKAKSDDPEGEKKASRDSVFNAHHQKYRAGLILNYKNVTGQGSAARFVLPFISPTDSCASPHLKAVCEALGITDLTELSFNVEEKTREPEAIPIVSCISLIDLLCRLSSLAAVTCATVPMQCWFSSSMPASNLKGIGRPVRVFGTAFQLPWIVLSWIQLANPINVTGLFLSLLLQYCLSSLYQSN